jgi:hypothetical protein
VPFGALPASALFGARGDLTTVAVHPRAPTDPAASLRRLGPPPGAATVAGALQSLVTGAADLAWRLVSDRDDAVDPLLAAVRARGSATSRELAADLGCEITDVRTRAAPLVEAGLVRRTGHARATRYRA